MRKDKLVAVPILLGGVLCSGASACSQADQTMAGSAGESMARAGTPSASSGSAGLAGQVSSLGGTAGSPIGGAGASNGGSTGSAGAPLGGGGFAGVGGEAGALGGAAGSGSGGNTLGLKNDPVKSHGCGQALGKLTSGSHMITSSGSQREYTIDIPSNYEPAHPYRLFFTFHWIGASDQVLVTGLVEGNTSSGGPDKYAYYGLKRQADMANDPAIFIAPSSMGATWGEQDHALFDALLALAKDNLCIDTSRVFATGFSFGAMMTYSLSTNHQQDLRAVVGMAPANYNIYLPTNTHEPIPYMSTTGVNDMMCPWDAGNQRGAKYAALGHAMDNGCSIPAEIPTATAGSKSHVCYEFTGCKPGYPVKVCTFDGVHQASVADGGTQNNGLTSWIPPDSWKFFSQF
jgi:hypothetical protein